MRIVVLQESSPETRVPLTPVAAEKLVKLGFEVFTEAKLGEHLGFADSSYRRVGAEVLADRDALLSRAEVLVKLNCPSDGEIIGALRPKTVLVGLLDPFRNLSLVRTLAERQISTLCMELIPRSSYAQKMDVLSSQASLAGYAAVLVAAERIDKVLPMMSTPAGTIPPARVFVIGAGVAGLQAIATAKRLGARVEAFDTRPVVEEQVQSLGAKFVKIDVGETGQNEQGYAQALTPEQLERQRQGMAKVCAASDIVITTAQLFGKPAPRLLTKEMVAGMRPGSVIVDLAASTGGNVECTKADEEVLVGGVRLVGLTNLPGTVARDASGMYANNVVNLLAHLWNKETEALKLSPDDAIADACLLTHEGTVRHPAIRDLVLAPVEG
jgi:NAD(P) transhydrogenase subunit alpha